MTIIGAERKGIFMRRKFLTGERGLLGILFLLAGLLITSPAHATAAWSDGLIKESNPGYCIASSSWVANTKSYVGHWVDPSLPLPQTGDLIWVHAVAAVTGCSADGLEIDFFLPDGASLAISSLNTVKCTYGNGTSYYDIANCMQTPILKNDSSYSFVHQGTMLSSTTLAPGWWMEIIVPMVFNKELHGSNGPNFGVNAIGTFSTMAPVDAITVSYRAQFQNLSSHDITLDSANLSLALFSYYSGGQFFIDFGTTTALTETTQPATVPSNAVSFSAVTATLTGLSAATFYNWRARFVTASGATFTSATQTFATLPFPFVQAPLQQDLTIHPGFGLGHRWWLP